MKANVKNPIALRATNLSKKFGAVTALGGVDLQIRRGEIMTLLGPSGSGKTTLLRVIAGFEQPDSGVVQLEESDITDLVPAKRSIGMVFQNYALFPHMTVAENIAFPLRMRGVSRKVSQLKIDEVLTQVELSGYQKRYPRQLSGGQQQRVALARAIVFDPPLLLLDEPFGALDRKLRETMQLEMRRLQQKLGLTTLFVTHDQEEALILSDRIAVMNAGRIEQLGEPELIYQRPASWFVADFIGESNIFEGDIVERRGDDVVIRLAQGLDDLFTAKNTLEEGADRVGLLLRPERIRRLVDGESADNRFEAVVEETIYLGQSQKLRLRLQSGLELACRWPMIHFGRNYQVGDRVTIGWDAHETPLLPSRENGERIP